MRLDQRKKLDEIRKLWCEYVETYKIPASGDGENMIELGVVLVHGAFNDKIWEDYIKENKGTFYFGFKDIRNKDYFPFVNVISYPWSK